MGLSDREISYKTLFFHFINLTWPPRPQKEKIWNFWRDVGVEPPWVCHTLVPWAQSSWVLGLSYEVYIFFCTSIGSVRNWSKAGGYIVFVFTFIWIWPQQISKTTPWIFQICRDCDQKTIRIPKLNVLYQISLSEDFKNIFFFIIMSSNREKMFVWNASIWVDGPCRYVRALCVR